MAAKLVCGIDWSDGEDVTAIIFGKKEGNDTVVTNVIHLTVEETQAFREALGLRDNKHDL